MEDYEAEMSDITDPIEFKEAMKDRSYYELERIWENPSSMPELQDAASGAQNAISKWQDIGNVQISQTKSDREINIINQLVSREHRDVQRMARDMIEEPEGLWDQWDPNVETDFATRQQIRDFKDNAFRVERALTDTINKMHAWSDSNNGATALNFARMVSSDEYNAVLKYRRMRYFDELKE